MSDEVVNIDGMAILEIEDREGIRGQSSKLVRREGERAAPAPGRGPAGAPWHRFERGRVAGADARRYAEDLCDLLDRVARRDQGLYPSCALPSRRCSRGDSWPAAHARLANCR